MMQAPVKEPDPAEERCFDCGLQAMPVMYVPSYCRARTRRGSDCLEPAQHRSASGQRRASFFNEE